MFKERSHMFVIRGIIFDFRFQLLLLYDHKSIFSSFFQPKIN